MAILILICLACITLALILIYWLGRSIGAIINALLLLHRQIIGPRYRSGRRKP